MLVKITKMWGDESGDCGFKFKNGSSKFFVIVIVYLTDNIGIEDIKKRFEGTKKDSNLTEDYELKFSRCNDALKIKILNIINRLPIEYKAIVVDKQNIGAPALSLQPQQLYCEMMRRLLYDNNPPLEKATLVIDEAVAKIHQKEFNWVLKKYLSKNVLGSIKQKKSKNEVMIQIADIIAGSIFKKFEKQKEEHHNTISSKEKILIKF